jgi:hypothetical protein
MSKFTLLAILLFCGFGAVAQTTPAPAAKPDTLAPNLTVVVNKDPRMDLLASKKIAVLNDAGGLASTENIKISKTTGLVNMPGYRLQVLNTTDRTQAYQAKALLYQKFPGHAVYVIAQAPFFKVRFGNFISKDDADRYKRMISPLFPAGVYLVPETIEARVNRTSPAPAKDKEKEKEKKDK